LENLQDAGLVYGKTIYNKAPVVMRMLAGKLGDKTFRLGMQIYLQKYAYANASWDDLIDILDELTSEDLKAWSHSWVAEKGMPEIRLSVENDILKEQWIDPEGLGRIWPQALHHELMPGGFVLPNTDGAGYGFFYLDVESQHWNLVHWGSLEDPVTRLSVLINLHEHLTRRLIPPAVFTESLLKQLPIEENVQIFGSLLSYLQAAIKMEPNLLPACEETLWRIVRTHPQREFKQMAFNLLIEKAATPASVETLYNVWSKQQPPSGIYLSENQYMTLAYELAVRLPELAEPIVRQQLLRLTNPDKIREFSFITPAVSPQKTVRDSLFFSFLKVENRRIEPWLVKALRYLNHPLRQEEALDYILPALDILPEIQRTGDIFLPANWCAALLDGHTSLVAAERLSDFLETHRDMPVLLKNKVLQNGDWLLREHYQIFKTPPDSPH
jgi:aminopeptidase N